MSAETQSSQGLPLNLPPGAVVRLLRAQGGMPKGATIRPLRSSDQRIGATEPETGRPVLQQSPRAEVNQAAATAEHPAVRAALAKAIKPIGGAKLAGARDEKDPERVQEKIEDDGQSPRTVRDYSGFRIAVDSPEAHQAVAGALRQHFEVPDEQDEFDKGNPETGFHGHTLQVREPGSPVSHEVQVLPREVAAHADSRHGLYEKAREGDDDAAAKLKAANEADWQKFQKRQQGNETTSEPKYKYGNTQANIPKGSAAAQALDKFRSAIPGKHLAGDGKDIGDGGNHVTLRYGIDGDDTSGIERYLAAQKPFTARLGETDVFPPTEHSDGAAVVHAKVVAPELERMNAEIANHGNFAPSDFKDYKPHATIAYVDPKAADQYRGRADLKGSEFPVDHVMISDRNGNQRAVKLGGNGAKSAQAGAGEIDASQVHGEKFTGYEASEGKGEFACHNCHFSDENSTCGQPTMVAKSQLPRVGDRVQIDPKGCCEYVDRKGKATADPSAAASPRSAPAQDDSPAGAATPKDKFRQMTAGRRSGTDGEQAVAEKKNFEGRAVALAGGGAGVVEHYQPAVNGSPARARVRMPDGKIRDNVKPGELRVLTEPPIDPESGWTAEDLDGTLAKYHGFKGKEVIGEPIPDELARVKRMLANGKDVRIFTARIADDTTGKTRAAIHAWCQQHLGQVLPVTNVKDDKMVQVRDDRAVALERNTGRIK